jgi:hypothetical protein
VTIRCCRNFNPAKDTIFFPQTKELEKGRPHCTPCHRWLSLGFNTGESYYRWFGDYIFSSGDFLSLVRTLALSWNNSSIWHQDVILTSSQSCAKLSLSLSVAMVSMSFAGRSKTVVGRVRFNCSLHALKNSNFSTGGC